MEIVEKNIKKQKKHSFLSFYPILINLVPKYCVNLIFFEKNDKKFFGSILIGTK